ncbi:hypothetical protein FRB90_000116 [Tulasnella sp. 427]|nr:hypothetical protein FRB90_000116 [Tulasnella sp. 427]
MGSTGGTVIWGESRTDRLCRNFDARTGNPIGHKRCNSSKHANSSSPCPFVHPDNPRWLQLGGSLSNSPPHSSSGFHSAYQTASTSSTNWSPPIELQPPRRRPFPPSAAQRRSSEVSDIPPPAPHPSSGTVDPRRRPSNLSTASGGVESPDVDLARIHADMQTPDFQALLDTIRGPRSPVIQPPTPQTSVPPQSASWTPTHSSTHPQPQAQPQPQPHPPAPAPAPQMKQSWGDSTSNWGHRARSPPRRDSYDKPPPSSRSSDSWGKAGSSTDDSWAKPSSTKTAPNDGWASTSSSNWGAASTANWGAGSTANWGAGSTENWGAGSTENWGAGSTENGGSGSSANWGSLGWGSATSRDAQPTASHSSTSENPGPEKPSTTSAPPTTTTTKPAPVSKPIPTGPRERQSSVTSNASWSNAEPKPVASSREAARMDEPMQISEPPKVVPRQESRNASGSNSEPKPLPSKSATTRDDVSMKVLKPLATIPGRQGPSSTSSTAPRTIAQPKSAASSVAMSRRDEPMEISEVTAPPKPVPEERASTSTPSVQPKKLIIQVPKAHRPKQYSIDEQLHSPDRAFEPSEPDDDPELASWRTIIKDLGSAYRDYTQHQGLAKQLSEVEALAQWQASRIEPQPTADARRADPGPYSGRIKDLRGQVQSLSQKQEARAREWANAAEAHSTTKGATQSGEVALLDERRSKSLWPFEPPEGKYISKGEAAGEEAMNEESVKAQIQKLLETLDETKTELDRIQSELIGEMQALEIGSRTTGQATEARPTTARSTPDDFDLSEELRQIIRDVNRLGRDVDMIKDEPSAMVEDAHVALGLPMPEEEDEPDEQMSETPDPLKAAQFEVNSDLDGDDMDLDGRHPSTVPEVLEDETLEVPMEDRVENVGKLLNDTADQAVILDKTVSALGGEEMCQADIGMLAKSNEALERKLLELAEQGRNEDDLIQELYGAVMALEIRAQPDINQLIDGIVKSVVDEMGSYLQRELGQRAATQEQVWDTLATQIDAMIEPHFALFRGFLGQRGSPVQSPGYSNGATGRKK